MTQTRTFAQSDLTQIVSCCQQECGVFHRAHDHASPACVELFRRVRLGSQQTVERDAVLQEALFAAAWLRSGAEPGATVLSATLEPDGLWHVADVAAGAYTLQLLIDDEQIVVRDLVVGYN